MIRGIKTFSALIMLLVLLVASLSVSAVEVDNREELNDSARLDPADLRNTGSLPPVDVNYVKIDGDKLENGRPVRRVLERGEEIEIKVQLEANQDAKDIKVMAWVAGDEHFDLTEQSDRINKLESGDQQIVVLKLRVPEVVDVDKYQLHIFVSERNTAVATFNYPLKIESKKHSLVIEDVIFNPNAQVQAGRALLSIVRIENLGEEPEESIRVTVSIPELGVSASDVINELDEDDATSSEELYMRIPPNAEPKVYEVLVDVEYDRRTERTTEVHSIEVVNDGFSTKGTDGSEGGKTVVQVGPETQDVVKGEGGAIFPVTLSNEGSAAKSYVIGVSGTDSFATVELSPSNVVVVEPGQTEAVYVYLSAREDAQVGAHTFTVDIKAGDKTLQQIPLNANVVEGSDSSWDNLKKGLEIGLVVLIIILIILGLIVAFTRAKKSEEDEEEDLSGQTYY